MSASWYVGATVDSPVRFETRDVEVEWAGHFARSHVGLFSIRRNLGEHEARALCHALNLCLGLVDETTGVQR